MRARVRFAAVTGGALMLIGGGGALALASVQSTPQPQVPTVRVQATNGNAEFAVVACPASYPYLIGGGAAAVGEPLWWNAPYSANPYWHYIGPNAGNAWMAAASGTAGYVSAFAICER